MKGNLLYALNRRQGKAIRCALIIAAAALWQTGICVADSVTLPELRDLSLTNWNCQTEGTPRNPAGAARNRMKNRDWIAVNAANIAAWDYAQCVEHARAFSEALGNPAHRSNLTAEVAAKLSTIETQIVSVTGWL